MSDTRARANRFAFWFGSLFRNGLMTRRAPPGVVVAAGRGAAAAAAAAGTLGRGTAAMGCVTDSWAEAAGRISAAAGATGAGGGDNGGGDNGGGNTRGCVSRGGSPIGRPAGAAGTAPGGIGAEKVGRGAGAPPVAPENAGVDGLADGVAARGGVNGPGAPGRGCGGVAPAGMGEGNGGMAGRAIDVTGGSGGACGGACGGRGGGTGGGADGRCAGCAGGPNDGVDALHVGDGAGGADSVTDSIAACDSRSGVRGMVIGSGTGAMGATGVGHIAPRGGVSTGAGEGTAAAARSGAAMEMIPPHTEQRARTPTVGTFDGSTRNTDRHSGHDTFTTPPPRWLRRALAAAARHHWPPRHRGGRS